MLVDIPLADAVEKLTILQIEADRITDAARLDNISSEMEYLRDQLQDVVSRISAEMERLSNVNRKLVEFEDQVRQLERARQFGNEFVKLARLVSIANDERASIKHEINMKCEARLIDDSEHSTGEVKSNVEQSRSPLTIAERRVFSQNGEDGVIESTFAAVGDTNRYYVEFGCGDGSECNTTLLEGRGWNGLLMDDEYHNTTVPRIHRERVTAENINQLFDKYGVPPAFDLLSIDIDGNDYWVWKAIERSPRLVVIEYNAHIPPDSKLVIKYDPNFIWNGSDYFGASLLALVELAEDKGYTLFYCEHTGANAFFLRNDLLPEGYMPPAVDVLYQPPNYLNQGLRWPRDPVRKMIVPDI